MFSTLTVEKQIDKVVKLRDEEDLTFEQIGDRLGFSDRTARRRYRAGVLANEAETIETFGDTLPEDVQIDVDLKSVYVPNGKGPIERFEPLNRIGDAIVSADYHIPLHDPNMVNIMIEYARQNKIKNLIIAGDYFNMDSFSSYLPHQPEASWQIEQQEGVQIMAALLNTFDEIDIIWGNHDFRLTKALGFKHSFTECMKWALEPLGKSALSKIRFSDLDYMYYYPRAELDPPCPNMLRVCHPTNFSSIPLSVPRRLAPKYDCGIMSAHSHHLSMGLAANGYDLIIELGGFFDKERTEYIQKTTAHHEWVQGFVAFKDGVPELVGPTIGNHLPYSKGGH